MGVSLLIPGAAFSQQPTIPAPPADVVLETGLVYSTVGERLEMDVARPAGAGGPYPAVVCIHGGGFRAGKRQSYLPLVYRLAQHGYVAATITYRLAPKNQFPAPVHDSKAAVRYLRANAHRFNLDPDHIGVTGGSAGGHLALFVGLTGGVPQFEGSGPNLDQSSRVQAVVNYYGPSDFTKSYGKSVDAAEVLPLFLGGDLAHAERIHRVASPLNWVSPDAAPTLSIHGTVDRYVAFEQSQWLTERLKAAGVEADLVAIEGSDHGFKGADAEKAEKLLMAFFDSHLKPKPERRILVSDHGPNGEVLELAWPSGKVLWRMPNQRGHDVQPLPNGGVLFTIGAEHAVVEVNRDGRVVWSYGPAEGLEHPLAAQRLSNGNTLIGDARLGKVIEVSPDRKVVWEYANPDLAEMRMRNSRRTAQGTTLIAIERMGRIIEVDNGGKIVWQWEAPGGAKRLPYQAWRLENGNTLISMADPGEVVEVTPQGKVVRSIGGEDPAIRMGWSSGIYPLPGGGVLISDYTGRRLLEVDAQGKLVNELRTGPMTIASVALVPAN